MSANSVFILVLLAVLASGIAVAIATLRWGLRWARIREIGMLKAFGLYCTVVVCSLIVGSIAGWMLYLIGVDPPSPWWEVMGYAVQILVPCLLISRLYTAKFLQAVVAAIPYLVASNASMAFAVLVIRPYVYEAYSVPTNAMAPTILGEHLVSTCPNCGAPAYGSPPDQRTKEHDYGRRLICSKELRSVAVRNAPITRYEGDRILACKLLTPRRWDLIVFRFPQNPSETYVKRLVGLPGERVEIRAGAIWIDGNRVEPPEGIKGIQYSPTLEWESRVVRGPGSVPVQLGPDEYYVLGDFVEQSADSRFWETGAPGHPPYAVPQSHLIGVVINIYWPIDRWKTFR